FNIIFLTINDKDDATFPQREIQVKREELLEYAQSIISGLKRNDEIVSFTKESSDTT
ncbi:hypothetical protein ACJX0J_031828, partial [Zea mays]